jgi:hypothetical protein
MNVKGTVEILLDRRIGLDVLFLWSHGGSGEGITRWREASLGSRVYILPLRPRVDAQ